MSTEWKNGPVVPRSIVTLIEQITMDWWNGDDTEYSFRNFCTQRLEKAGYSLTPDFTVEDCNVSLTADGGSEHGT